MVQTRFNRFTRWFLWAVSLLALSVMLYVGKAMAQGQLNAPGPLREAVQLAVRPAAASLSVYVPGKKAANPKPVESAPVTILPDRIILPPQVPAASVTLSDYDVDTSIKDNIATTTITQTYKNTSGQTLEARYLFPLPPDANFSSFTLTVNDKALEGKILEKQEARNTYQEIVRKLIDPGLLEYLDDKTVQVSIAPFFAGETKQIRLSYTQLLKQDGGLYKYSYFLGTQTGGSIHRPVPPGIIRMVKPSAGPSKILAVPHEPSEQAVNAGLTLNVDLKTSQPLKTIYSPTHDPKVERQGNTKATVKLSLKPDEVRQEKSFVLYFSQDNSAVSLNTLNFQRAGEDGYFLMSVRTPDAIKKQEVLPKDVVLVVDTSGSMSGEKIKQAKEALKFIINRLNPDDRFALLQFNTDVSFFGGELLPANAEKKRLALDYVDILQAQGSTNIEAAMKEGFAQLKNHDATRPAYVIFLTDGEPTVGITDTEGLVKVADQANTYNAKLFSFGVGYDLNAVLLGKLSDHNHGATTFVEPNENLELAMTSFYKKIEAPVLTDATLDFTGLKVSKLYPEKLGDLFAGSEVILLGRYAGSGHGTVKLSGKVGGETKTFSYPLQWDANTQHSQLPRLWAGRRIAYLLDTIRQNGENQELKDEVIALSKQYGIITPYTSYLSVEREDYRRPLASPAGAMNMPAAAAPMASQSAMDSASGRGAVKLSKALGAMKAQASNYALNAAQAAPAASAESKAAEPTLKTIGSKTFTRSKDGVWTDTAYEEKQDGKPIQVSFGSDAYFKLLAEKPELLQYFTLGEQVIVVLQAPNGSRSVYQVLPTKTG